MPLVDERRLEALRAEFSPVIGGEGIGRQHFIVPNQYDVVDDVPQDIAGIAVLRPGQALKTSGVGDCYAICATARLPNGLTLAGISHTSMVRPAMDSPEIAREEIRLLVQDMRARAPGCVPRVYIAGGLVSRLQPADANAEPASHEGSIEEGRCLVEAAGPLLVSAHLGLSEMEEIPQASLVGYAQEGWAMQPTRGRPECVSVYVDADGHVSYVDGAADHCKPARDRQGSDDAVDAELALSLTPALAALFRLEGAGLNPPPDAT